MLRLKPSTSTSFQELDAWERTVSSIRNPHDKELTRQGRSKQSHTARSLSKLQKILTIPLWTYPFHPSFWEEKNSGIQPFPSLPPDVQRLGPGHGRSKPELPINLRPCATRPAAWCAVWPGKNGKNMGNKTWGNQWDDGKMMDTWLEKNGYWWIIWWNVTEKLWQNDEKGSPEKRGNESQHPTYPYFPQKIFHPQTFHPDTFHPQTFHPESFTHTSHPYTFHPQTVQPYTSRPQTLPPYTFHPLVFHPHTFHPETLHPEILLAQTFHPETFHPQPFNPQAFHPYTFHPRLFNHILFTQKFSPIHFLHTDFSPTDFSPADFAPSDFHILYIYIYIYIIFFEFSII